MSNETTRAIERGAAIGPMAYTQAMTDPEVPHVWRYVSGAILTTALTDPNDADSLARTLWFLHKSESGWATTVAAFENTTTPGERERWRAVADGLRTILLGATQ